MTDQEYGLFLSVAAYVCAVGAIFNLFKLKKRGNSALILSSAFLVMAALLWMIKTHASQTLISTLGTIVAALLVGDVILRSKQQDRPR
jgi:hypothetical protein